MAAYTALVPLAQNDTLKLQVKMAVAVTAFTITGESTGTTNHAARVVWAKQALANPDSAVEQVMWYVLAANNAATVGQITTATDAAVQANVDAAVNGLFGV
jgi:hypothetical protein